MTTFTIPDAKGRDQAYAVRPLVPAPNFTTWTVEVTNQKSQAVYRVSVTRGEWACSCPAFEYSKPGAKQCKHVHKVREVLEAAALLGCVLAPVSATEAPATAEVF